MLAVALGVGLFACVAPLSEEDPRAQDVDYSDVDTSVDIGDVAIDVPEPDACDVVDRVTAVRVRSVPGGRKLHLLLSDREGNALPADYVTCLSVRDAVLGPLPSTHTITRPADGDTLIVARWTPDEVAASRTFIDAFVASRPAGERVAVWAWSDRLHQVVGATADRERIRRRLDHGFSADPATPISPEEAGAQAAEAWERLAEDASLGPRNVVFVAPGLTLGDLPELDRDYVTDFWVVADGDAERMTLVGSDPGVAADGVAAALDSARDAGLGVLGFCDDGGPLDLSLSVGNRDVRRFTIGDAADEHRGITCDLQTVLDAEPRAFPAVEFRFTETERAEFDRLRGTLDGETPFFGELRLDRTEGWVGFEASQRGQSSLGCERKSYTVNLDGGDARHLLPNSGTDEFTLISMCLDNNYINQINGNAWLRMLGLWHVQLATVDLRVDGESHGVYLALEKLDDELERDISGIRSVIRRRTERERTETDFSHDGDDAAALARYHAMIDAFVTGQHADLSGDALVSTLRASLDLDQYLRWVALMTLLENGDYIDEVFFVAEETVAADHTPDEYYGIHAWDVDDLFSACEGRHLDRAIKDPDDASRPHPLLYCAESAFDHTIFADDAVMTLYVDTLEQVLDAITPEDVETVALATRDNLLAWFEDDNVRGAMTQFQVESGALDHDAVRVRLTEATDVLVANVERSRAQLRERIAAYRSSQ